MDGLQVIAAGEVAPQIDQVRHGLVTRPQRDGLWFDLVHPIPDVSERNVLFAASRGQVVQVAQRRERSEAAVGDRGIEDNDAHVICVRQGDAVVVRVRHRGAHYAAGIRITTGRVQDDLGVEPDLGACWCAVGIGRGTVRGGQEDRRRDQSG